MAAELPPEGVPAMDPATIQGLKARLKELRARNAGPWHHCRDCPQWYGAEDDEYGPCMYKHLRGEERYVTPGGHECDEPQELRARGLI